MQYCFNDDKGCSSCRAADEFNSLDASFWAQHKERFEKLAPYVDNDNSNFDCLIPVSGEKMAFIKLMCVKNMG